MTDDKGITAKIISPEDVENIAKEALEATYKKATTYLLHDFYDSCQKYMYEHFDNLSMNLWTEIANQIIRGYKNGRWSEYDHAELRKTLLREHHDEIIVLLNQDLLEENMKLKERVNFLEKERNY